MQNKNKIVCSCCRTSAQLGHWGATLWKLPYRNRNNTQGSGTCWCIAVAQTTTGQQGATLSHVENFLCSATWPPRWWNDENPQMFSFFLFFNKRFLFLCRFYTFLRHHAQKNKHTKGIMLTPYQKIRCSNIWRFAVKNKFVQIWHVSWHVSESRSRLLSALTVSVNMALSKTGLRIRQEKGKACFNVGLNFPDKHATHL